MCAKSSEGWGDTAMLLNVSLYTNSYDGLNSYVEPYTGTVYASGVYPIIIGNTYPDCIYPPNGAVSPGEIIYEAVAPGYGPPHWVDVVADIPDYDPLGLVSGAILSELSLETPIVHRFNTNNCYAVVYGRFSGTPAGYWTAAWTKRLFDPPILPFGFQTTWIDFRTIQVRCPQPYEYEYVGPASSVGPTIESGTWTWYFDGLPLPMVPNQNQTYTFNSDGPHVILLDLQNGGRRTVSGFGFWVTSPQTDFEWKVDELFFINEEDGFKYPGKDEFFGHIVNKTTWGEYGPAGGQPAPGLILLSENLGDGRFVFDGIEFPGEGAYSVKAQGVGNGYFGAKLTKTIRIFPPLAGYFIDHTKTLFVAIKKPFQPSDIEIARLPFWRVGAFSREVLFVLENYRAPQIWGDKGILYLSAQKRRTLEELSAGVDYDSGEYHLFRSTDYGKNWIQIMAQ